MAESPITMFGVYVSNISVSLGWGGQGGSMQLTLVEDETNNVVLDKDENGYPFYGSESSPQTGSACYFKYGSFYFGGIFQRWTYKEDATGGRTYDVVLESPSKYLDGVWVIIENFNGATDAFANAIEGNYSTNINGFHATYGNRVNDAAGGSLFNVFNLFGAYENPFFGPNGPYQNFGASGYNSDGMPIANVLNAVEILIERGSTEPFGGPIILGEDATGGTASSFGMNLSELSAFFTSNGFTSSNLNAYTIKGPTKSVNGLMGELAEMFQFDYYWDIQPDNIGALADGGGRLDQSDIVLRVTDKTQPPDPNRIRTFIEGELNKPDDQKTVMNYTLGKEFATTVTQKIVWGGRRTRYLQLDPNLYGWAVWGLTNPNASTSYNLVGISGSVYSSTLTPKPIYGDTGRGTSYLVSPLELRMSMLSKEAWQTFKTMQTLAGSEPNYGTNLLQCPWACQTDFTSNILNLLQNGLGNAFDAVNTNFQKAFKQWNEELASQADKIYSMVSNVANTSYKQEYFVRMPSEVGNQNYNIYYPTFLDIQGNAVYETNSKKAWDVSSSAYIENAPVSDVAFFDSAGKLGSMAGWPFTGGGDYSPLGSDWAFGGNGIVSKKGSPSGDTFWFTNGLAGNPGLYTFFKTGAAPKLFDNATTPDFGLTVLADLLFGLQIPPASYIASGKTSLQFGVPPDVITPNYFGIPQESQRFNYGPWVTEPSLKVSTGLAEAVENNYTPETYGSYSALASVGVIAARTADTSLHESESGYIQMVGAPIANIGQRFANTGPYVTNMDISVDPTGGVTTTYKFNTWTPEFAKLAKYNIDRIAKTNKTGWETAKKRRDLISNPAFPKIKFEKTDFSQQNNDQMSNFDAHGITTAFRNTGQVNMGG